MADNKNIKDKLTGGGSKGKSPKSKINFYWIYALLAVVFFTTYLINFDSGAEKINWGELKEMLTHGDVERIILVNKEKAEIFIKPDKLSSNARKLCGKSPI